MPVTSFALWVLFALAAALCLLWAMSAWGVTTTVPLVLAAVLLARWAFAHVPHDDSTP